MLKRLAALLIALLLPAAALAEAYVAEIHVSIDEEEYVSAMSSMVEAAGISEELFSGVDPEKLYRALAQIANGMGVRVQGQLDPPALDMEIQLKNTTLSDMQLFLNDEDLLLTSSLFPQYAFQFGVSDDLTAVDPEAILASLDIPLLLDSLEKAFASFSEHAQIRTEMGTFSGDAYVDGSACLSVTFDDGAVSTAVQAFLNDELINSLSALEEAAGIEIAGILEQFRERSIQVAQDNSYAYLLRYVTDDEAAPVGLSMSVSKHDEPILTVSAGISKQELRIVIGLGMNQTNYWHSQVINWDESSDGIHLKGELREYSASKSSAYAYACTAPDEIYVAVDWNALVTPDQDGISFSAEVMMPLDLSVNGTQIMDTSTSVIHGRLDYSPFTLTYTMEEFFGPGRVMVADFRIAPCASLSIPSTGELSILEPESSDPEMLALCDEVMQNMVNKMTVRMLKLLPLDLILSIPQLVQIP